jgi:two-component system, OmpR family, KDP operon response regulator KdpE
MSGPHVLVVDDEAPLRRAMELNLSARGYTVTLAVDGADALRAASEHAPDVVVLDLGLPDIDGLEVIGAIRMWSSVPIVVLSARGDERSKVAALDTGADDFVTKPFGIEELLARLRVALRRASAVDVVGPLITDDFQVDFAAHTAEGTDGSAIRLTPIEWRILEALAHQRGRLVTHQQLLTAVWGPGYERETHYLRVHLTHLRAKLEPNPSTPRYLITEPGSGHRLDA